MCHFACVRYLCCLLLLCTLPALAGCHHVRTLRPQPPEAIPFVSRYPNGSPKTEGAHLRHKQAGRVSYTKHGFFTRWYADGSIANEGRYHHGKPHGIHSTWNTYHRLALQLIYSYPQGVQHVHRKEYDANEKLREEMIYQGRECIKKVRWQGHWKQREEEFRSHNRTHTIKLYKDGKPKQAYAFRRGKRHGLQRKWYANGQLSQQKQYEQGLLVGTFSRWYESGQILTQRTYTRARKKAPVTYIQRGFRRFRMEVRDTSCPHGSWKRWSPKGVLTMHYQYHKCHTVGLWRTWYPNGQMMTRFQHQGGIRQGSTQSWHANGRLASKGWYVNGYLDGKELWWHPNGKRHLERTYVDRHIHGVVQRWDQLGYLRQERHYAKGLLHGPSTWYFSSGEPSRLEHFWKGRLCGVAIRFGRTGNIKRKRQYPACHDTPTP